jgi:Lipocalin-like domain
MKKNLLTPAILVIFALTMGACSKNSDKKSNMELLTKSVWKYQIIGIDADKNGEVDAEDPNFEACSKDDTYLFKTDNTGVFDEGGSKCDPADEQTASFSWQFQDGEKKLNFDGDSFTILSLNDNNMKIYYEVALGGTTIRVLLVLKH